MSTPSWTERATAAKGRVRRVGAAGLEELEGRVTGCRRCPRLVEWRERVAADKRAAFRDEDYWGRPVPGFGDPSASVYVLGLTGAFVAAAVRCAPPANRPLPSERDNCLPYAARELELLCPRVIVCLGGFAWDAACRLLGLRPKPRFGHGAEHSVEGGPVLLGTYHPSQQNTFTGRLT